jgi:formate hydrogenlyase subunit 6/NADH:ubiquinone oxidoreductase subunit I
VKRKRITRKKKPQVSLCSGIRCGLCEEYCPKKPKATWHTEEFSGAGTDKDVVVG